MHHLFFILRMILLVQNSFNYVFTTLTEKKVTSGDTYLFELVNEETKQRFYTVLEDNSTSTERYNEFLLLVTGSAAAQTGSLDLQLLGSYNYAIYETTSSLQITSSCGLNQVEVGQAKVISLATSSIPAFTSSYNPSPVFDPKQYNL